MKGIMQKITGNKYFHLCVILLIIAGILTVLEIMMFNYKMQGETNMPFELSKITVISSQEGISKENAEYKWAYDINQNNDIYFYINKNNEYERQEAISEIIIDNINVNSKNNKEKINIYKPNSNPEIAKIFVNAEEYKTNLIAYKGDMESIIQQSKINNQGGVICIRISIDKVAELLLNEDTINHNELLKKANVNEEELQFEVNFDVTIKIQSGKEYKTNIQLKLPQNGVVENGTSSEEKTDLKNIIFKRIKN